MGALVVIACLHLVGTVVLKVGFLEQQYQYYLGNL